MKVATQYKVTVGSNEYPIIAVSQISAVANALAIEYMNIYRANKNMHNILLAAKTNIDYWLDKIKPDNDRVAASIEQTYSADPSYIYIKVQIIQSGRTYCYKAKCC